MDGRTQAARIDGGPPPPYEHGTVTEALAAAANSDAKVTFLDLHERETVFRWSEVYERAKRAAAVLAKAGLAPGDRLILSSPTSPDFLDAFFGALFVGGIPVPIAPAARTQGVYAARLRHLVKELEPKIVVMDGPSIQTLKKTGFEETLPVVPIEGLSSQGPETHERKAHPDDVAFLQLSSGSVGEPKPVMVAHRHLTQHCAILGGGMPGVDVAVSWLPLYHDMGLIAFLLKSVCDRKDLVLFKPDHFVLRPSMWLRAISKYRGQFCSVPNFAYALCNSKVTEADLEGCDLSCYRHSLNGAEPINATIFRKFGEKFARWGLNPTCLRPTYGLAEATLAVTISPEGTGIRSMYIDPAHLARTGEIIEGTREVCSLGPPYPGVQVEIRDEQGNPLPERRVGAVWINSPTNMYGYFRNEAASKKALKDGWLDSGDVGFIEKGELYLVTRAKDIIVIRGGNHSPVEFEEALVGMDGLRSGGVIAVGMIPDDAPGEELVIFVERMAKTDKEDLTKKIRAAVLEHSGIRAHSVIFVKRGHLPRTTSGKVRRSECLRQYLAGELPLDTKGDAESDAEG